MANEDEVLTELDERKKKLEALNMEVETKIIIDESEIVDIVEKHLRRQLNGRTSESLGM